MSMIRPLAAMILLAMPLPALAQAYQCVPPARIGPARPVEPDGPSRRTPIGGFTLAASWSPEYCHGAKHGGGGDGGMQCNGRNGRFGFILHGLWPESNSGPPPQWCGGPAPSPDVLRQNLCMSPSPDLLAHEWAKHGSCMAPTPDAYFRASAALWRSLRWPDADRLSRQQGLTAGDLRDAFVAIDPDWRRDQVGLALSRGGWLQEVRLCYSARYLPAGCPRRSYGAPDSAALKIWRGM